MRRVVMYSGGLGSFATALHVAFTHGCDDLVLLFADVKGNNPSPHVGEDPDTYRFIAETAEYLGGELITLNEGRDIWQVFKDDRFLGNSRLANCSKFLKQKPCREWLDANCDPENTTVYVGIDWSEAHRLPAIVKAYLPFVAEAPLVEPSIAHRYDTRKYLADAGIEIPRLYAAGFPHNNCGGGCVRAGQAQFALLLRENRPRYMVWEKNEESLRKHLDADVAILKDRTKGRALPLTLKSFREGIDAQTQLFDPLDFGGCGCFVDDEVPA